MTLSQKAVALVVTLGLNVLLFAYFGILALIFTVPSLAFLGRVLSTL